MSETIPDAEAELEAFRQKWREEVSARSSRLARLGLQETSSSKIADSERPQQPVAGPSKHQTNDEHAELTEPRSYHDLPNRDELLTLEATGRAHNAQPSSALEHYERAVEKEAQGQLGDSVHHYRQAFKMDDSVHEAYKNKHFPANASAQLKPSVPSNTGTHGTAAAPERSADNLPSTLKQMLDDFSSLSIEPPPPLISGLPQTRSYLGELPEEILAGILMALATADVAAFVRLALVCKRLAFLVMTEEKVWKEIALGRDVGFKAMHYDYVCKIDGSSPDLGSTSPPAQTLTAGGPSEDLLEAVTFSSMPEEREIELALLSERLLQTHYAMSWRNMFRTRPRIRFNGCYISTVNYTRAGGSSTNTLTWGVPVHIVTYYRYLRFFRDGTVLSLLSTAEPADVVHYLTKGNAHKRHRNDSTLPNAVMKDALHGRWRLSGPASSFTKPDTDELEVEGDVHVETEGVVPRYIYRMHLAMSHAGKGTRNNKLAWRGFWSYNRLADDWAEFSLRNDKAFYWSRVKSYYHSSE